jgi:hypothetical protein
VVALGESAAREGRDSKCGTMISCCSSLLGIGTEAVIAHAPLAAEGATTLLARASSTP